MASVWDPKVPAIVVDENPEKDQSESESPDRFTLIHAHQEPGKAGSAVLHQLSNVTIEEVITHLRNFFPKL